MVSPVLREGFPPQATGEPEGWEIIFSVYTMISLNSPAFLGLNQSCQFETETQENKDVAHITGWDFICIWLFVNWYKALQILKYSLELTSALRPLYPLSDKRGLMSRTEINI